MLLLDENLANFIHLKTWERKEMYSLQKKNKEAEYISKKIIGNSNNESLRKLITTLTRTPMK
jgi:hypothetical protein